MDIRSFGDHPELTEHAGWLAGDTPPLQSTWSKLIRIQLARLERPSMIDDVRRYQRDELGAADGADCLLELLPLPSPGVSDWHYAQWSDLDWLSSRGAYREHLLDHRVASLRALVHEHQPEIVVFYGIGYIDEWEAIAGAAFGDPNGYALQLDGGPTTFLVVPHPAG